MPDLPVDIDTTYPDDAERPDRKLHQQHHDALHTRYNEENAVGPLDGQTDDDHTALGVDSGKRPPAANGGTFIGVAAGLDVTGNNNTFVGQSAGRFTLAGIGNVAVGLESGPTNDGINDSVAVGKNAECLGDHGIAIGAGADTESDGIAIGFEAEALAGEVVLGHLKFGHVATVVWTVTIDGVDYEIAVTPV